jgi:hypothetical protein
LPRAISSSSRATSSESPGARIEVNDKLCSQKSVELYEKEGVFMYEEFAQEDCREILQPRI